jgi:hypothetical protein
MPEIGALDCPLLSIKMPPLSEAEEIVLRKQLLPSATDDMIEAYDQNFVEVRLSPT